MKRLVIHSLLVLVIIVVMSVSADLVAQCPMCKIAAESNLEHGGTSGKGLNKGILYMFMMPYLLVGTIGFVWYRNRKKNGEALEEPSLA